MTWTVSKLLQWSQLYLAEKGIEESRLQVEYLLAHVLAKKRLSLYLESDRVLNETELAAFKTLLQRRSQKEPLQYILGTHLFMDLNLKVGPGVFIPRFETEVLVENVLEAFQKREMKTARILELGIGTGAISLAIAKKYPDMAIVGVDVSAEALKYAKENIGLHACSQIELRQGDLFSSIEPHEKFDVIISNPPYLAEPLWASLKDEVKLHEPKEALFSGEEGLDCILKIIETSRYYLKPEGMLFVEFSPEQRDQIEAVFKKDTFFTMWKFVRDYEHRDRLFIAERGKT
ncbi:MAG: peptide chain release factor N(5)-glutamine methyltransferase [Deltaproteobacteria bacterium]|nr:peptide chain release factor N(5)-glutamine methyltransferase [Deltaproteobacteria bacterium]